MRRCDVARLAGLSQIALSIPQLKKEREMQVAGGHGDHQY